MENDQLLKIIASLESIGKETEPSYGAMSTKTFFLVGLKILDQMNNWIVTAPPIVNNTSLVAVDMPSEPASARETVSSVLAAIREFDDDDLRSFQMLLPVVVPELVPSTVDATSLVVYQTPKTAGGTPPQYTPVKNAYRMIWAYFSELHTLCELALLVWGVYKHFVAEKKIQQEKEELLRTLEKIQEENRERIHNFELDIEEKKSAIRTLQKDIGGAQQEKEELVRTLEEIQEENRERVRNFELDIEEKKSAIRTLQKDIGGAHTSAAAEYDSASAAAGDDDGAAEALRGLQRFLNADYLQEQSAAIKQMSALVDTLRKATLKCRERNDHRQIAYDNLDADLASTILGKRVVNSGAMEAISKFLVGACEKIVVSDELSAVPLEAFGLLLKRSTNTLTQTCHTLSALYDGIQAQKNKSTGNITMKLTEFIKTYQNTPLFAVYVYLNHEQGTKSYIMPCTSHKKGFRVQTIDGERAQTQSGKYLDNNKDLDITSQACGGSVGFAVPSACGTTSVYTYYKSWRGTIPRGNKVAVQAFGVSGSGKTYSLLDKKNANSFRNSLERDGYRLTAVYVCEGQVKFYDDPLAVNTREFLVCKAGLDKIDFHVNENKRLYRIPTDQDVFKYAHQIMSELGMIRETFNNPQSTRAFQCLVFEHDTENTVYMWDIPGAEQPLEILRFQPPEISQYFKGQDVNVSNMQTIIGNLVDIALYDEDSTTRNRIHSVLILVGQSMFINLVLQRLAALNSNKLMPMTSKKQMEWTITNPEFKNSKTKENLGIKSYKMSRATMDIKLNDLCTTFDGNQTFDTSMPNDLNVTGFFSQDNLSKFVVVLARTWLDPEEKRAVQLAETQRIINILFHPPTVSEDDALLELCDKLLMNFEMPRQSVKTLQLANQGIEPVNEALQSEQTAPEALQSEQTAPRTGIKGFFPESI